jgi:hypothetical protein
MKSHAKNWSARVTQESNALTLEKGVFTKHRSRAIAWSLKRSAEKSRRRKSSAFRSAMSMLTFYINRMGTQLSAGRRKVLEQAKEDLREVFGRRNAGSGRT